MAHSRTSPGQILTLLQPINRLGRSRHASPALSLQLAAFFTAAPCPALL